MLPNASWLKMPVAATGPTAGIDPVVVNPNLPAIEPVEQAAWRPDAARSRKKPIAVKVFAVFMNFS
jgi:hypothetical protein